jgi:hypothetical protein
LTKTVFSLIVGQWENGGFVALVSSPVLWITAIVLVGTYVLQIVVTVSGLEVTSAIIVISAHSVTEEVMATTGGILYFQDYLRFESWAWAVFIIGNVIAIASVIGLSHLRLRDAEAKEEQARRRASGELPGDSMFYDALQSYLGVDPVDPGIRRRTFTTGHLQLMECEHDYLDDKEEDDLELGKKKNKQKGEISLRRRTLTW